MAATDTPHDAARGSPPRVSILMPTYNGERYIARAIDSVLSQTFTALELIVCDDASTDRTPDILASYQDPRLVVVRNEQNRGVVGSRNRAFAMARGEYAALLDHDDLCRPQRIERQIAYLDAHPQTVLLATAGHELRDGALTLPPHPPVATPRLIAWNLRLANQLIASSIMFRSEVVRRLGCFMREDFAYADDYEFYHRIGRLGEIARLDERLLIYRRHAGNASLAHTALMTARAVEALAPSYEALFGAQAREAAELIVRHVAALEPVPDTQTWTRLVAVFDQVNAQAWADPALTGQERAAMQTHAALLWQRCLQVTAAAGRVGVGALLRGGPAGFVPPLAAKLRIGLGRIPGSSALRAHLPAAAQHQLRATPADLLGARYEPLPIDPDRVPRLYVIVDTEAEFDWTQPFARDLTAVGAMRRIETAQAIFDRYALRPVYFIDYPVASQAEGYGRLREILARSACEIGVHLHPWTTPPFEEPLGGYNSFAGNLDPGLEARKIAVMVQTIRDNLGVQPVFYRAGRYGVGPQTALTLARLGLWVDLSLLPGADLRARGGPDFRAITTAAYRIGDTGVISLPMSRAVVGAAPAMARLAARAERLPLLRHARLRSIFARAGLADEITLTPEGVTLAEQIQLVRGLLGRGVRDFVMHYHSPTLAPGNTPYARDEGEVGLILARLTGLCQFFFEELGGLPGYPRDLLRYAHGVHGLAAAGTSGSPAAIGATPAA